MSYQKSVALLCCAFLISALVPDQAKAFTSELSISGSVEPTKSHSFSAEKEEFVLSIETTFASPPDTEGPVITITPPSDVTLFGCYGDLTFSLGSMGKPQYTVYDDCGSASVVQTHADSFTYCAEADDASPEGGLTIERTFTLVAEDCYGNTTTELVVQTISVLDNSAPSFIEALPNDTTVDCGAIPTAPVLTANDTCDSDVTVDYVELATSDCSGITRTWTATDDCGNSTIHVQNITVTDSENPVISDTPSDISKENDAALCGAVASWSEPTATDNCALKSLVSDHDSGDLFPVGTTTVTYTATDSCGNSATTTFNVVVSDTEDPLLAGMPSNMSQVNDLDSCGAIVTWPLPTFTDNCPEAVLTSTYSPGDYFQLGETTVSYTATDSTGNDTTATFTVTIVDNQKPAIAGLPANIDMNAEAGICEASVNWTAPTSTDNCEITSFVGDYSSGDTFDVGTTSVTYTATDGAGNDSIASFTVTITDDQNPVITDVPADITQTAELDSCSAIVTWSALSSDDNCEISSFTGDYDSGDRFPVGTTVVTYTALDVHGNDTTATFSITITDDQHPVLNGVPMDITQTMDADSCGAVVTWTPPTVAENCTQTLTSSHNPGDYFDAGPTTVTYISADPSGGADTASFTITTTDDEAPVILNTPADFGVDSDAGVCTAVATWTPPTASDNCGQTMTSTHNPGDTFESGETVVSYVSVDAAGNQDSTAFTITVSDNEAPVLTAMAMDTTSDCAGLTDTSDLDAWLANHGGSTATDNCDSLAWTHNFAGDCNVEVGDFNTHEQGGWGSTSGGVHDNLNNNFDAIFPSGVTVGCSAGYEIVFTTADAIETYLPCTGDAESLVISHSGPNPEASSDPSCWNNALVSQILTAKLNAQFDANLPSFSSSDLLLGDLVATSGVFMGMSANDIITVADSIVGDCSTSYTLNDIRAVLNDFNRNYAGAQVDEGLFAPAACFYGNCGGTGSVTVTFTATDEAGNTSSTTASFTSVDNTPPTISAQDFTLALDSTGVATLTAANVDTGTADACGFDTLTLSQTAFDCSHLGEVTVTLTALDDCGNSSTEDVTITVTDTIAPNITAADVADITQDSDANVCTAVVTWTDPSTWDNCAGETLSYSHDPGSTFDAGVTTVTITVTDGSLNADSLTFDVTIEDNQVPTISAMAQVDAETSATTCDAVVTWTDPVTSDNCPGDTLTYSHDPGSTFALGTTAVTAYVTDNALNVDSVKFDVVVVDATDPTITDMPADTTLNNDAGLCGAALTWAEPSSSDNCPGETLSADYTLGYTFPVGTTTVTYTATDAASNQATSTFDVTVLDNEEPAIQGLPSDTLLSSDDGVCSAIFTWDEPTATDNCNVTAFSKISTGTIVYTALDDQGDPIGTLEVSETDTIFLSSDDSDVSIAAFPFGATTVSYMGIDAAGNSITSSFVVTVEDNEDPIIAPMSDITVNTAPGLCTQVVTWTAPAVTDNCALDTLYSTHETGATFSAANGGETTVTYLALDSTGNQTQMSFKVTVSDNEPPVVTAASDSTVECAWTNGSEISAWLSNHGGATATDNCSGDLTWTNDFSFDEEPNWICGLTTEIEVTFTATDGNLNSSTTTASFIIEDTTAPVFNQTLPGDTTVNCESVPAAVGLTAQDLCSVEVAVTYAPDTVLGTCPHEYTINRTWSTIDDCGNPATHTQVITVQDTVAPMITVQAMDSIIPCDGTDHSADFASWRAAYGGAEATESCGGIAWTESYVMGSTCAGDSAQVTFTATDECGNFSTTTAVWMMEDVTAPMIVDTACNMIVECDGSGNVAAIQSWLDTHGGASATEECSGVKWSNDFTTMGMTCGNTSAVQVVFTATDSCMNASHTVATFTIKDTTPPSFVEALPADGTFECDAVPTAETLTAMDICGGSMPVTYNQQRVDSICPDTYRLMRTWTTADSCGNTASHTQKLIIEDTTAPLVVGKDYTIYLDNNGSAILVADSLDNGSSDNCSTPFFSADQTTFYCGQLGANPVILTASDSCLNTANTNVLVTVLDTISPVFEDEFGDPAYAEDKTVECDGTDYTADLNNWIANHGGADAGDNCVTPSWSNSAVNFVAGCGNSGSYTITFTATDGSGNSSSTTATYYIKDTTAPVISSPATNVTVECNGSGNIEDLTSWVEANGGAGPTTDACGDVTWSNNFAGFGATCSGSSAVEVTYYATDDCGNVASTSSIFTIEDTTAPELTTAAADTTVECDGAGNTAALSAWLSNNGGAIADEICGDVTWTYSPESPTLSDACAESGDLEVTFTAKDGCGNTVVSTAMFIVTDITSPTAIAQDVTVYLDANGLATITTADVDNGSSDDCGDVTMSLDVTSFDCDDVGPNPVVLTVWDACMNADSATITVNVTALDSLAPNVANLPADTTLTADPGMCTAVVNFAMPTIDDNCDGGSLTSSHNTGDAFPVGTTTVTFVVEDASQNTDSTTFDITVTDDELPKFTGVPNNISVNSDLGVCTAAPNWAGPSVTDNCGIDALISTHDSGDTFQLGTTTVTYTATDIHGNVDSVSFTVEVADAEKPAIAGLPSDITQGNDVGDCSAAVTWTLPTATDNCEMDTLISSHASGDVFQVGETVVTYTATDAAGNDSIASFKVTVTDTEKPGIENLPADITQSNDQDDCSAVVTWEGFDAATDSYINVEESDNCPGANISSTHNSGDTFPVGVTTVTYTATDAAGNDSIASFTVTITDDQKPAIDGLPTDFSQTADADSCGALVSWTPPTSTDNCTGDTLATSHEVGAYFLVGTTTVTYTATDSVGNDSIASFVITVTDDQSPAIDGLPGDLTVSNDTDSCGAVVTWSAPSAADNCEVDTLYTSHASGDYFPVGSTTVTYTAEDIHGNSTDSTFVVLVNDMQNPDITAASDSTVECDGSGNTEALNAWLTSYGGATATDNCDIVSIAHDYNEVNMVGACGMTGAVLVTFTATDFAGNTSTTSASFIIQDTTPPTFAPTGASEVVECDGNGNSDELTAWLQIWDSGITVTDNCGGVSVGKTSTILTDECGATGMASVSFVATDACGNQTDTTLTFTIEDTTPPTLLTTAQDSTVECDGAGNQAAFDAWLTSHGGATAEDVCGNYTWSNDFTALSDDCGATGSATVMFTATDECGNKSTTTATFTIEDTTDPSIASEAQNKTVECDGSGNTTELNNWLDANGNAGVASDDCGTVEWSNNFTELSDDCGFTGTATVIFTATDECDNTSTTEATFTIEDTTAPDVPVLTCPKDTVLYADANCFVDTTTTSIGFATATAFDACDSLPTINISYVDAAAVYTCTADADNAVEGSYGFTRTWTSTVTDECGLTSASTSCIQTIAVLDTVSPILVASMDTTVECDGAGNPADLAAWLANNGGSTGTDNCDSELAWSNDYDPANFVDSCGATGHVVVTFAAKDDCGNTSFTTATFTIEDTTPPAFSATAEDLTVECDGAGNTTDLNNWLAANANAAASDICGGVTWTNDFIDLTDECGATGRRTVTFTATDDCGNYVYTSSTFTIEDTTDPAIASEAQDLTVECDGTGNTIELNGWLNSNGGAGAAADACGDVTWSNDFVALSDDCGATGSATVIFTATDDCGLSASTTATFTIEDKTDPAIASEAQNLTVECDGAGNAAELNNWLDANGNAGTASDACGDVVWSHDFVALSDDCGATGSATVIFTATDECGNTSATSAIFTIEDTVDPAIASEAQDLTVECDGAGNPTDLANWLNANGNAGAASDACGDVVWSNDFTALSDDCGATGAATVIFTATDECGNTSTTSATFTIEDTTDPILSGDEVVIIDCAQWPWEALYQPTIDELLTVVDTAGNPMITLDESCGYTNFPIDFGVMSGGCSYDHQLIYYPVDACGNTGDSLYQVIQVDDFSDPVFTHVPADTMIACTENVMVYLEMATAIDACDPSVNMTFQDEVIPTACPEEFTIRRTFYAEDCGYNIAEAVQTITVADTAAPSLAITAPSDTVFYGCLSSPDLSLEATGTVTWLESDDCGEVTVTFTTTDVSTYTCTADDAVEEGSHLVTRTFTVTAVDCAGNSTTKTVDQVITITDNEVPMATLTAPADTTIYLDETCFASDVAHPVSGDATGFLVDASDNCDSEVAHTIVHEDDTTYTGVADGVGSFDILRTYTVTLVDDCGNDTTETTSHMIHVMDTIHPATYTDFPNDTIIYADDSNGYFDPTPSSTGGPLVNYSDNCSGSGDSQYGVIGQSASTGGLIITAIADPNSGASCRFVEIHNSSDAGINLSGYALQRWTNGNSGPSASNNIDLSPIGTLEPGVYAHIARSTDFSDCYGFAPDIVGSGSGPVDSNGDDQVAIIDGSANIIDIFGVIGEAGDNNCHDFEDGMALRAGSNTDPNAGTWDESGWIVYSDYSTASGCTNHNANQPQGPADIAPFVSSWAGAAPPAEETDFNSTDMNFADVTTSYTASACYTFERTWTVTVTDNNGNATTTSSVQTIAVSDTTAPVITADAETTAACDLFGFDLSAGDESTLLAGTSFEQASTGSQYTDTGDASEDHALVNNPGQADVNFTAANGEMGFTSYFYTTGSGGLSNDFTGVSSYTGTVGAFTDGAQGFQMTDVDGLMELTFDEVDVSDGGVTLSIDAFIQSTGWEVADLVRIWIVADGGEVDLLNTTGQDIDNLGIEDQWITYTLDLDGYDSAELHVSLASNSGSETLYIDNISFSQGNSPLAALMANGYVAFNDNVELASTAASITLDGTTCEGAYDIVYSATDSCGNASSMSQRIELVDTVDPVLTVIEPADTVIYADANCFADYIDGVPYPAASATDNCDEDVEITAYHVDSPKQYACLPGTGAFTLQRTYTTTATDNCGNEHTVQVNRLVTVLDTIKPTFNVTAPAALFVNIDPFCGANTSTTIGGEPTITDVDDNCDIDVDVATTHVDSAPVYTCSDADGTAEGSYTFVRTFTITATDDCGNEMVQTVTQTVTATDVTSPVITAVPAMPEEVFSLDSDCYADLSPTASPTAVASDACDSDVAISSVYVDSAPIYTCSDSDGEAEGSFSFTRTWTVTATDDCANSSSQQTSQMVSVLDELAPSLIATWPSDYATGLDANCAADLSPTMAGEATATGDDACDSQVEIAISHADHDTTLLAVNVDALAEGGYTFIRTWTATATDDCGNETSETHDQVITANDVLAPSQTLETLPTYTVEGCYGDVDLSPATTGTPNVTAQDACDSELDIDVTYTTDDLAFNEVMGNYTLVIDTISGPEEGIIGSTTVRMYIETENEGDFISAVAGDLTNPTGIRTTTSFYQNALGSNTANNLSGLLLAADPMLAYDSWVTIGLEEAPNAAGGELETSTIGDWNVEFAAGGNLLISDFFGGSWYTIYPNTAAVAGADQRVLLGQFTTDGQMSGQLFVQVFPNGIGTDEQRLSFTFGDCAEDDDTPEGSYSFTRRWESVVTDDANNQDTAVNYQHIMVLDTEAPQLTNTCDIDNGEVVEYDCPGQGVLDFDPVPAPCDVTAIDNCDSEVNVNLFTETAGYIPTDLIRNYCAPTTPEAQGGAQTCDDRAPEVLRLFNFPGMDDSFVMAGNDNLVQVLSDGSMGISLEVQNADGTGGFVMTASYGAGQDWATWQAGGSNYKKDCAEIYPGEAVWEDWIYFMMTSGNLEGTGMYAGSSFSLTHQPSNGYYGMQMGLGANNKNTNYGGSAWFFWQGNLFMNGVDMGPMASSGDVYMDMDCCLEWEVNYFYTALDDCGNPTGFSYSESMGSGIGNGDADVSGGHTVGPVDLTSAGGIKEPIRITGLAPNPTNDQSQLTFVVSQNMRLRVDLYTMEGLLVQELYQGNAVTGVQYMMDIDADDLSAGMYQVRVSSNIYLAVKKLLVAD